jgi:hypothetical protein
MGVGGSKVVRFAICDLRITPEKAATATLLIGYRKSQMVRFVMEADCRSAIRKLRRKLPRHFVNRNRKSALANGWL